MIRRAVSLGLAAVLLPAAGAAAAPAPPTSPTPAPATRPTPVPAVPSTALACPRAPGVAPSQALLDALGVLRRPAAAQDALPGAVLGLLKARGLAPDDPASARLLRTTADGGRAWIVPVPCVRSSRAGEGVVVVATGGAPAGGGAALPDIVRGRGAVSVDVCAGPGHDMLGVSGVVPDGVTAAYLTAPDGTAVRADVAHNGYAFVVPAQRHPDRRYVVWTGGDGTPHVQPVPVVVRSGTGACRAPRTNAIRMSPEPGLCPIAAVVPVPPVPARRRVPSTRPARPTPMAAPVAPCLVPAVPAPARVPRPPAVSVPKP